MKTPNIFSNKHWRVSRDPYRSLSLSLVPSSILLLRVFVFNVWLWWWLAELKKERGRDGGHWSLLTRTQRTARATFFIPDLLIFSYVGYSGGPSHGLYSLFVLLSPKYLFIILFISFSWIKCWEWLINSLFFLSSVRSYS